jgi:PLP dependent protein
MSKINTKIENLKVKSDNQCKIVIDSTGLSVEQIIHAYISGHRIFGETDLEEFEEKSKELAITHPDIEWHFLSNIKKEDNKIKKMR